MRAAFHTPFDEQLDFFQRKLNLPTERWDDIQKSAHDRAFIVAGAQQADLLNDLHGAIEKAIRDGLGMEAFRRDFAAIVQRNGWHGWTGEGSAAGEAWRTKVIYQTNLSTSYAAGRYRQLTDPEFLRVAPWWRYVHDDSVLHPRPLHAAWGRARLTLRHDHPFWRTHYPPNGWGCQCRVTPVAEPESGASTDPPDGWSERDAKGNLPGIDKGFDYASGANVKRPWIEIINEKLLHLEAPIGAAMWKSLQPLLVAEQLSVYQDWIRRITLDDTAKSQTPTVGAMDPVDLQWLIDNGKRTPKTSEIGISSSVINGPKAIRHSNNGDSIPVWVWENLPEMLTNPLAVLYDTNKGTLLYVLPEASSRRPQLVVEFEYLRREQPGKNMIVSGYRPMLHHLEQRRRSNDLVLMRGSLE